MKNASMIYKLMLMDLRIHKNRIILWLLISLIMGMLMIFVNTNLSRMFMSVANTFIVIVVILPFFGELKDNSIWSHHASLPVTRKAMVAARYLLSLIMAVVLLLVWTAVFYGLTKVLNSDPQYAISPAIFKNVLLNILFILACFYFAFYRYGMAITMASYLFGMFVPIVVTTIFSKTAGDLPVVFSSSVFVPAAVLGLLLLSFVSSRIYFPKRDF